MVRQAPDLPVVEVASLALLQLRRLAVFSDLRLPVAEAASLVEGRLPQVEGVAFSVEVMQVPPEVVDSLGHLQQHQLEVLHPQAAVASLVV